MHKLQYDIDTAADPDAGAALRRLAEICIEAHGIVAREGPAEVRQPLEDLLGRIARQLGGGPADDAEASTERRGR